MMSELNDILAEFELNTLMLGYNEEDNDAEKLKENQLKASQQIRVLFLGLIEKSRETGAPLHRLTKWVKEL